MTLACRNRCAPVPQQIGCDALDCPKCAEQRAKARADRALDRFDRRASGAAVAQLVVTLPEDVRHLAADIEQWMRCRRALYRCLRRTFGHETWGLEATHPAGDQCHECGHKDPTPGRMSKPRCAECGTPRQFHPHFNFLLVPERPNPFMSEAELEQVRQIVRWAFGLEDERPVVVHYSYASGRGPRAKARIAHWCAYVLRAFPGWHKIWLPNIAWWGSRDARPRLDPNGDPLLCAECGETMHEIPAVRGLPPDVALPLVRAPGAFRLPEVSPGLADVLLRMASH